MPIDPSVLDRKSGEYRRSWNETEVMLYALAVGAGRPRDGAPVTLVAENVGGQPLAALPTVVLTKFLDAGGLRHQYGDFKASALVHAQQEVSFHAVVEPDMEVVAESEITGVYDKGSGALVETTTEVRDAESCSPIFTGVSSLFIRGEGGWGGPRGTSRPVVFPDRVPDVVHLWQTGTEQALLYRLTGDRNPIHSDPVVASSGGFPRPILHGLCTFGYAGRALTETVCDGDPRRLASLSGRFSAPVLPGERLTVEVWQGEGSEHAFRVRNDENVVLDHGRATLR